MGSRWEDDEEYQDDNLFPDIEGEDDKELSGEYIRILEKREEIESLKINIIQKQLNYDILRKTIAYLEKSWFWRFKSTSKKLDLIMETYQVFKALIDIDFEQEDVEEINAKL